MSKMRFMVGTIFSIPILALVSCSASQPAATSAPATTPAVPTLVPAGNLNQLTINLGPGRDADQSPGTAVFTAQGDKTQVVVTFKPGAPGVEQPGHIHEGTCPGVGEAIYPLSNAVNGKSTTVVNMSLKDLMGGGFSINFYKSIQELDIYVACGIIR